MSEGSTTPNLAEFVREILEAAGREDWDAILAHYAPDAVWDTEGMGTFEGPPAIRGFWEDWWSSYEHLRIDVLDVVELGNGVVVAAFHFRGPPKGTNAEAQTQIALVYEWVDDAIVHVTTYFDIADGRAAAERIAASKGYAMSQENVATVRGMCEAFLAGEFERALSLLDADVIWRGTIGGLDEARVVRGRDAVIASFAEGAEVWETHALQTERFIDSGDRVVVFWHEEGRGRSSGAKVQSDTAVIYTLRDNRVVDVQGYMNREHALEAAGLEQ